MKMAKRRVSWLLKNIYGRRAQAFINSACIFSRPAPSAADASTAATIFLSSPLDFTGLAEMLKRFESPLGNDCLT